jgi:hypothetical protein
MTHQRRTAPDHRNLIPWRFILSDVIAAPPGKLLSRGWLRDQEGPMNQEIHAEIERVAYDLYERSGREEGKDLINWLAAEKVVLVRLSLSGQIAGEDAAAKKDPSSRRRGRNGRKRHAAS